MGFLVFFPEGSFVHTPCGNQGFRKDLVPADRSSGTKFYVTDKKYFRVERSKSKRRLPKLVNELNKIQQINIFSK